MYAFWTPFPPIRSGTADYALAVVRLLAPRYPITVIVADEQYSPEARALARSVGAHLLPERDYPHLASSVELDVYFVANNEHHLNVYRRAETRPGLLVLHENATEYGYWLLVQREHRDEPGRWGELFAEEVRKTYPRQPRALGDHKLPTAPFVVSLAERMLAASTGVMVHNPVLAKRLSIENDREVVFVPHPPLPPVPDDARVEAWARLRQRLPERPLLFGSLGFASRYKRLPQVLRAYARFGREHPALVARTAFVIAGQADERTRAELAALREREDPGAGQWVQLPYLDEAELEALLARLDLVVNLRFPSCGEASGMLTRCLQLGRPTIVSDHAYGGSMPDDVVLKVSPVVGEEDALLRLFIRCARGEALLDPERVRRFAGSAFDPALFATLFGTCMERTRERQIHRV